MIRRIERDQVRVGMYVCGFGGSWFQHPFWRAKFLIESDEDVARIRDSGVPDVLVDDELGLAPDDGALKTATAQASPIPAISTNTRRPLTSGWHNARNDLQNSRRALERRQAQHLVDRSKRAMVGVFNAARLGRAPHIAEVVTIVDDISQSVSSNLNALLNVIRLKNKDEYTYLHSVAVCTLMVNVARQLGLDDDTARDLGLAGLLHDIGKMSVPEPVLNKEGKLTDEEFEIVKGHPSQGHELLSRVADMVPTALDVCLHHHEKINGSGYPYGLTQAEISLAARLGAICDVYDALTSDRPYKEAWSPAEAVGAMWGWDGHFDPDLLFAFMQSIGVFPVGMLVKLRSNRLGIVLDNARRNSRPRAVAFYSTRENCLCDPEIVRIKDSLDGDQILAPANPASWGLDDWDAMKERLLAGRLSPRAAARAA